jgi:hypothetical protein
MIQFIVSIDIMDVAMHLRTAVNQSCLNQSCACKLTNEKIRVQIPTRIPLGRTSAFLALKQRLAHQEHQGASVTQDSLVLELAPHAQVDIDLYTYDGASVDVGCTGVERVLVRVLIRVLSVCMSLDLPLRRAIL